MGCVTRSMTTAMLGLTLAMGCAHESYPPALPSDKSKLIWANSEFITKMPPPDDLSYRSPHARLVPTPEEWALWQPAPLPQRVCRGKGKKRRCKTITPTVVDQANKLAVVEPSSIHTYGGQSIQVRYPYDGRGMKIYKIYTSPAEVTQLLLPMDERLSTKLQLDKEIWEVRYGATGAEGARQEVVGIHPVAWPLASRTMLIFQSGIAPIYLDIIAREQPGMLSVTWELPPGPPKPPEVPMDQKAPRFNTEAAYASYTITAEGKQKLIPPWWPKAIVDDGRNTLIHFPDSLEGQRIPVVVGLQQNGTPALVASRFFVRKDRPDAGSWMYVQGLHPALRLSDAAGLKVKAVRDVPPEMKEVKYAK